jgi:hypothetical protein
MTICLPPDLLPLIETTGSFRDTRLTAFPGGKRDESYNRLDFTDVHDNPGLHSLCC